MILPPLTATASTQCDFASAVYTWPWVRMRSAPAPAHAEPQSAAHHVKAKVSNRGRSIERGIRLPRSEGRVAIELLASEECEQHFCAIDVRRRDLEEILVEYREIGSLADRDRAGLLLDELSFGGSDREAVDQRIERNAMFCALRHLRQQE